MSCVPSRVGRVTRSTAAWSRCKEGQQEQRRPEYAAEHDNSLRQSYSLSYFGVGGHASARNLTLGGGNWFRLQQHLQPKPHLALAGTATAQPSHAVAKSHARTGLQPQAARRRSQTGCWSLVPKRRLELTVNIVVECALEPPCLRPVASLAPSRTPSARLSQPARHLLVNIIVRTRLKCQSCHHACSDLGEHSCWLAQRKGPHKSHRHL